MDLLLESALLRDAGFRHGFSTRYGGTDTARLGPRLGVDPSVIAQVNQVHGARIVRVAAAERDIARLRDEDADGLVAAPAPTPGATHAIGIRVADCVPVLVASPRTGVVAALHAGWRGLVAGVLAHGVAEMRALHADDALVAAVGPCIGPCCFEVGADVARAISDACEGADVIAQRVGDKAFVDLRRATHAHLAMVGVTAVDDVPGCTRCDATRFYSYRREGTLAGRHLALIVAGGAASAES